jgi:hypothetical protein
MMMGQITDTDGRVDVVEVGGGRPRHGLHKHDLIQITE